MLQSGSRFVTMIQPGFGIFDMGISTLADQSYYQIRTQLKAYLQSIILIKSVKDVYFSKQLRKGFPKKSNSRAHKPLELIHTDMCGPIKLSSLGKSNYSLFFVDDFSRKTQMYFLKQKSEVFEAFKRFNAAVKKESGHKISSTNILITFSTKVGTKWCVLC